MLLAAVQQLTVVAVWFFVGRFLSVGANQEVENYGGNYVAYVLVGVILNQVALAALDSPFQIISEAFWDKRLETYRLAVHGIWANIIGRLGWQILFATVLQGLTFLGVLSLGQMPLHNGINWFLVLVTFLLLTGANAGLGIAGSSLFFLLEVKVGQDPITWTYRYLVMLVSGLYVPLSILPGWLSGLAGILPQTSAFAAMRALLLTGADWSSPLVGGNILTLAAGTFVCVAVGYSLLAYALRRAERKSGIGVVV